MSLLNYSSKIRTNFKILNRKRQKCLWNTLEPLKEEDVLGSFLKDSRNEKDWKIYQQEVFALYIIPRW